MTALNETGLKYVLQSLKSRIWKEVYPVGAIYMSVNSTDPSSLFGGTWEQIKDTFLLSAGDNYSAGTAGGSADATLVSHTHGTGSSSWTTFAVTQPDGSITRGSVKSGTGASNVVKSDSALNNDVSQVETVGESATGKNMPPYLAVYMWKRTA